MDEVVEMWERGGQGNVWEGYNEKITQVIKLIEEGDADVTKVLVPWGKDGGPDQISMLMFFMHMPADVEIVKSLINAGANVEETWENGDTVLHRFMKMTLGATVDDIILKQIVDILTNAGVDVTIKNKEGKTALEGVRGGGGLQQPPSPPSVTPSCRPPSPDERGVDEET
jgi:hypothetical protein